MLTASMKKIGPASINLIGRAWLSHNKDLDVVTISKFTNELLPANGILTVFWTAFVKENH